MCFKQIPVLFKVYADFECISTSLEDNEGHCLKKYPDHIPCNFAYKLVSVDDKFSKPIVFYRGETAAFKFIEAILKEYEYCKKVMKKEFNKNLIMTEQEEEQFQSSNTCWICEKLIDDENIRDHRHITEKFRGAAHWCNINLKLTKKVPVPFHNLRYYDGHLIYYEVKNMMQKLM